MAEMQSYHCRSGYFPELIAETEEWLKAQGFKCQKLPLDDGGTLLQIQKTGGWRKVISGVSTALNLVFHQVADTVEVEIGAGNWIDQRSARVVSYLMLWPLAITAGVGAWEQMQTPQRIFQFLGRAIRIDSLDPIMEALDRQSTLPKAQRDESSLGEILAWCDGQLDDPGIDDVASAAITYHRARTLWLLGNTVQAHDDLLGLELIEQERKRETDSGTVAELRKRIQREQPKTMVERTILADIFRLLAKLSMEEKRCDAAMAFLQKASQVGDPHTERQTKHAIRQLHGQHSVALQENPPGRRQILFCTTDIPCWPPEGFCFASAATLRGTSWKFEAGHPQLNLFYVRHPLRPDQYYELEGFHDRVFEDKRQELVNLLKSIGATHVREEAFKRSLQERSVATGRVQEMRARIFGLGGFGAHTGESQVTEHRQVSQLETQEYDLYPTQPPQIPQDLVWYPHEAKWQSIAQDALSGSLKKVTVRLEYREDFSINGKRAEQLAAGLDLFDYQEGVRWFHETEERLQQQMDTIWEFTASFGAVAALQ